MTFTSLAFIPFFIAVTILYYLLPARSRWVLLLVASCYFYMAFVPKYILILFALILVDFCMAQLIEAAAGKRRTAFFLISVISNVGMLFVFKYFNFFNQNISELAHLLHWNYSISSLQLILPLGLSFHTFQSLSYVIEVYRGKFQAEKHLGIYALYVLFFPQLIAGPIERPQHLLPQLKMDVQFDSERVFSGLRLMAWGFFKKLVIADRSALSVDFVYQNFNHLSGLSVFLSAILFAFQLYMDFSGYSDIARGSARVLGIDVVRNFASPYFSLSVAEFWRRWHISLSSWFRDYFYYPLVYSARRVTRAWLYICLFITFLATGLWHGAGWTFLILGALHGTYLTVGLITKSWRDTLAQISGLARLPRIRKIMQTLITFLLVCFSWIFFRAPDLTTAIQYIERMFVKGPPLHNMLTAYFFSPYVELGIGRADVILIVCGVALVLCVEQMQFRSLLLPTFDRLPLLARTMAYSGIGLAILVFGIFATKQFIYFQF